jgi:Mrp family chromosome partitioning ATPase
MNYGRGLITWLVGSETRMSDLPWLGSGWMQNSSAFSEDLKTFSQATRIPGLRVVTTGGVPPNPAEVLGSERMRQFLNMAQQAFDVVVIDSPPCGAVTDPVVLAQSVDGVLLVLDAHTTARQAARRASENLRNVNARLVGVVMNRLDRSKGRYYYYSRYYSSYYYEQDDEEGRASKHNGHKNGRKPSGGKKKNETAPETLEEGDMVE